MDRLRCAVLAESHCREFQFAKVLLAISHVATRHCSMRLPERRLMQRQRSIRSTSVMEQVRIQPDAYRHGSIVVCTYSGADASCCDVPQYRGAILQGGLGIHSRQAWWQAAGQDQGTAESAASCHSLDTGRSLSRHCQRALLCAEVASCLDFLQLPLCIHPEMLGA